VSSNARFAAFARDPPAFLRTSLVRHALTPVPQARGGLAELSAGLCAIDTFFITDAEMRRAGRPAREVSSNAHILRLRLAIFCI
jgi:hypothetical protein